MVLNLDDLDFILKKFHSLCSAVQNYTTITMAEYLSAQELPEKFIIMRHDIDRKPKSALNTAKIEQKFSIRATYYFRANSNVFRPEIMQEIESMGHEVGYHYEVLGKAKGNHKKAIEMFERELGKFRKVCDVKTICMHGDPLSRYDNRDLWKSYNFRHFGIAGEAYLSIEKGINYFSDTGRSWSSKNNLRDFMLGGGGSVVDTTNDMIGLIKSNRINKLYILTHPERWASNNLEWGLSYMTDLAFNIGKKVLVAMR